jgi:hypothetical protein
MIAAIIRNSTLSTYMLCLLFHTSFSRSPLDSAHIYICGLPRADTTEALSPVVVQFYRNCFQGVTKMAQCTTSFRTDTLLLAYHNDYKPEAAKQMTQILPCDADYVMIISVKSRSDAQHREPVVFITGGVPNYSPATGTYSSSPMRSTVIPREGYDYSWKASTSCTAYDTRTGRRMLVASGTLAHTGKSHVDTVDYKSACSIDSLFGPLKKAVADVVSQMRQEKAWREYQKANSR